MDEEDLGEEKKEKGYSLLDEGDENIRKIDFDTIIFRQLDRISRAGTEGNLGGFGNGISIQDALMEAFKDSQFFDSEKAITEKFNKYFESIERRKNEPDSDKVDVQALLAHYQSEMNLEKLKNMIKLLGKKKKI